MRIRNATLKDVPAIYRGSKPLFKNEKWFTETFIKRRVQAFSDLCYVLEENKKIIGADLIDDVGDYSAWGVILYIEKGFQHHGVATSFLKEIYKKLKRKGYKRLYGDINPKNEDSFSFHAKEGWQIVGSYKYWDDEDYVIMRKNL